MNEINFGNCRCGASNIRRWHISRAAQYMMAVCPKRRWFNFWKHDKTGPHAYFPKP